MGQLTTDKAKALEIYAKADDAGKAIMTELLGEEAFVPKVTDRIQNFEDILNDHGKTPEGFEQSCEGLEDDEIAYRQLKLLTSTYNLKKLPVEGQRVFTPYFTRTSSSGAGFAYHDYDHWLTASSVGARLEFLSLENMQDAVKKFLPIYERFYSIKTK